MVKKVLLFLLLSASLYAQVTLNTLMDETGTRLIWDSEHKIGTLSKGEDRIVFSTDAPSLLINYERTIPADPALYEKGILSFSDETARLIYDFFSSRREDNSYEVTTILLDPGHGGKDWGAYRPTLVDEQQTYLKEKNVNLDMALRLEELLKKKYPDKTIALTRRTDEYIDLKERVAIAESYEFSPQEGMIFLSLHANASLNKKARGFEIWYLPDNVERDLVDGDESQAVSQVLNTLWEGIFTRECYNFARFLLNSIDESYPEDFPNRGLKRELWYVLRNKNMVSALAELAFISNEEDIPLLQDEEFLDDYARALADGIGDFIEYFEK
ncbi:MAG: N-acetylmuramoyl-L-alanine amidase [Spirochaetales bacterium]|nr:N-acetylmuramoyl-L-alanine amidase [Spirochaetales bacterium]